MKYLVILIAFISTIATAQVTVGKFNSIQGDRTQTQSTLKITSPKEGDTLTNAKEIVITWEGIDPNIPVDIDCFYLDNWRQMYNWVSVARGVTGTSYKYELQKYLKHQRLMPIPVNYNNIKFRIKQSDPNFIKHKDVIKSFNYDFGVPFIIYKDKIIGYDNCYECFYKESLRIWDARTGLDIATLEQPRVGYDNYGPHIPPTGYTVFNISPDGTKLMMQGYDNEELELKTISIWDLSSYKLIKTFETQSKFAIFSIDSKSIIFFDEQDRIQNTIINYEYPIIVKNINTGNTEKRFKINSDSGTIQGVKRIGDKLLILIEKEVNTANWIYEVWDMNNYKYLYDIKEDKKYLSFIYQYRYGYDLEPSIDYSNKYLLQENDNEIRLLDLNSRKDTFSIAKSFDILNEIKRYNINTIPNVMTVNSNGNKWAFYSNNKFYIIDIDKKQLLFEKEYNISATASIKLKFVDNESKLMAIVQLNDYYKTNINILFDISNNNEIVIGGNDRRFNNIVINNSDTVMYLDPDPYLIKYGKFYWSKPYNKLEVYNPLKIQKDSSNIDFNKCYVIGRNKSSNLLITYVSDKISTKSFNKIYFFDLWKEKITDSMLVDDYKMFKPFSQFSENAKIDTKNNLLFITQIDNDVNSPLTLNIYNLSTKQLLNKITIDTLNEKTIDTSNDCVNNYSEFIFSDKGTHIAIRYGDSLFKIFDIYSGKLLKEFVAKDSIQFSTFQFTNEGNHLLLTSYKGEISFYEISSGNKTAWYQNPFKIRIGTTLLSDDDRKLFTLDNYGVNVWNTDNGELLRTINPLYALITTISINDDGSKLYVGEMDGTIVKYNITDTKYEQTMPLNLYFTYPPDSLDNDSTSIDPVNNDNPLVMSPNPSNDKIDIAYTFGEESGSASLFVYNVFGQVILSKEIPKTKTGKYTLNLKELPIGQYVVTISSPNSIQTQNFQIMR